MSLSTKIWTSLNSNSNTLGPTLLRKANSLVMISWNMPAQCIMQVSNKIVSIVFIKGHKCASHYDELNFIHIVAYFFQLFYPVSCLDIRIVSCSDSSHWCRLISCVRLRRILKVWVWTSRTVDTDISGGCNMRATMRFAHDSNNCYSTSCADWLCFKKRNKSALIVFRDGTDYFDKFWSLRNPVLLGDFWDERS